MSDDLSLDRLFTVSPRFTRSVSLVRDFESADALSGYILTPVGQDVLHRLSSSLQGDSSARAWSLTGPYGTGKSAFALLVAQLLAGEPIIRERARVYMRESDPQIGSELFDRGSPFYKKTTRLCPVLVSGSRQSLAASLATSLAGALRRLSPRGRPPHVVERLEAIASTEEPSGTAIVGLFEEANDYLKRFDDEASGILLIIDELGKFLEYGASHPNRGDVFILQELAEAATRSKRPFLVLTILHQALDRYAEHMSPSRRSEWAKIQGRFEDVAFEERNEQLLRLISHAIRCVAPASSRQAVRSQARSLALECVGIVGRIGSLDRKGLEDCLSASCPLHPLTTLTIGPLFRQLAQNERSLFAFLSSSEPFGFQEFLRGTRRRSEGWPTYRIDQLYDYVITSQGPSLYAHHRGKAWAEVESALERSRDATELEVRLAKTIGLLQAVGPTSLVQASKSVLQAALYETATPREIEAALDNLTRRSIAIYRRHLNSYALWEGSDIDIESRLEEARREVDREQPLAAFLMQTVPPEPKIARRHYFQKGTLRYFEVRYADLQNLRSEIDRDPGQSDGRIVLCLPLNSEERETMAGIMRASHAEAPPALVAALPQDLLDLREYCHELFCLRWVLQQTPGLETDRIAYRELHGRLDHAEQGIRQHLQQAFAPTGEAGSGCEWFYLGRSGVITQSKAVNEILSEVCDVVYEDTPTWRNELINRRSLSSAAAAARRNLIEAMIENGSDETLGFEGYPPELCMFETLLRSSRIHRKKAGVWGFFPPDAKSEQSVQHIWQTFDRFLSESEPKRLSVANLFDVLRRPPFGIKDGVLPVLFAAVLLHYDTEVALYDEGTFVARLNAATFERMFRAPERFEVQRFRIVGPRYDVFKRYAELLNRNSATAAGDAPDLLSLVKPLVRVVKELTEYVGKTQQTSAVAQSVLKVIREARQPDRLLFVDIPVACGFGAFEAEGNFSADEVNRFFDTLRTALAELQRAYPQLLAEIEKLVLAAFEKEGSLVQARVELNHEARLVLNLAVDAKLKGFLLRMTDLDSDDTTWLESVATLLTNRPPGLWDDRDRARFEVELAATARAFRHFKVLAFEIEKSGVSLLDGDPQMLRVSITTPTAGEFERVVQVPPHLQPRADRAQKALRSVLASEELLDNREISIAVLSQLVRELLTESERKPT